MIPSIVSIRLQLNELKAKLNQKNAQAKRLKSKNDILELNDPSNIRSRIDFQAYEKFKETVNGCSNGISHEERGSDALLLMPPLNRFHFSEHRHYQEQITEMEEQSLFSRGDSSCNILWPDQFPCSPWCLGDN